MIEETRAAFRPAAITTLFVGESAPASGDFFYYGTSAMTQYMRRAIEESLGPADPSDFLNRFKALGWYLDDLVLTPVDKLGRGERRAACRAAQAGLAARIAEYQPQAIVTVVLSVRGNVEAAAARAGSNAPRYAVAFPGQYHQLRFLAEMKEIIPQLPRNG